MSISREPAARLKFSVSFDIIAELTRYIRRPERYQQGPMVLLKHSKAQSTKLKIRNLETTLQINFIDEAEYTIVVNTLLFNVIPLETIVILAMALT